MPLRLIGCEPMYTICKSAIERGDLRICEPLGLSLADWATILGLLLAIAGGLKFLGGPIARRLVNRRDAGRFRSFKGLSSAVRRLAHENKRIFRTFGPKSGAADDGFDRFDVAAWHQARLNIRTNNERILLLLQNNIDLVPARYLQTFTEWINHIEAFSAHLNDPNVDYRHHRFPDKLDAILNL
jgi:hypothetical protein